MTSRQVLGGGPEISRRLPKERPYLGSAMTRIERQQTDTRDAHRRPQARPGQAFKTSSDKQSLLGQGVETRSLGRHDKAGMTKRDDKEKT